MLSGMLRRRAGLLVAFGTFDLFLVADRALGQAEVASVMRRRRAGFHLAFVLFALDLVPVTDRALGHESTSASCAQYGLPSEFGLRRVRWLQTRRRPVGRDAEHPRVKL